MYYDLNHQSYLIFVELEFRPYIRTMDLNKNDWRIKIKANNDSCSSLYCFVAFLADFSSSVEGCTEF